MGDILNFKFVLFSLLYAGFSTIFLYFQATSDYMSKLPNTTLAAIGLLLAATGGAVSYVWEKSKRRNASLRTNITFAIMAGIVIGLISYDRVVVQYEMVNGWLALLAAAGFANQTSLAVLSLVFRKRLADLGGVKEVKEVSHGPRSRDRKPMVE